MSTQNTNQKNPIIKTLRSKSNRDNSEDFGNSIGKFFAMGCLGMLLFFGSFFIAMAIDQEMGILWWIITFVVIIVILKIVEFVQGVSEIFNLFSSKKPKKTEPKKPVPAYKVIGTITDKSDRNKNYLFYFDGQSFSTSELYFDQFHIGDQIEMIQEENGKNISVKRIKPTP